MKTGRQESFGTSDGALYRHPSSRSPVNITHRYQQ